jgi:hypothetical protein
MCTCFHEERVLKKSVNCIHISIRKRLGDYLFEVRDKLEVCIREFTLYFHSHNKLN